MGIVLIRHTDILQNDTSTAFANTSVPSQNYHFLFVVRTLKICSLKNFQVYNRESVVIITVLHIISQNMLIF